MATYLSVAMFIEDFALTYLSTNRVRLTWTGTALYSAWIFINGILKEGPVSFESTERTLDFTVPDPFRIEIHEAPEGEAIDRAVGAALVRRPLVWWSPRESAIRYNVYRRPRVGDPVRAVASVAHDSGADHYETRPSEDMRQNGGVWNFLRVEVVNLRGIESVRDQFPLFVAGLPAKPTTLTPSGGAGVFALQLGV